MNWISSCLWLPLVAQGIVFILKTKDGTLVRLPLSNRITFFFHFCSQFYSRIKWTMNDTNFLLVRHCTSMSSHFQWIRYDGFIFLCRLLSFSVHICFFFFLTCSIYRILLWMMRRWLTGHCMKNIYRLSAFYFDYFERLFPLSFIWILNTNHLYI